jgi:hypothetical protein
MNERPKRPPGIADELRPYVDSSEAESLDAVARHLTDERPPPRAGFRSELHARLIELDARQHASRPKSLRAAVAAYMVPGAACLGLAALGLTGAGPLSP